MEERPASRASKVMSWATVALPLLAGSAFAWLDGGWRLIAWMWVPFLTFFGPVALAVGTGHGSLGKRANGRRSWGGRVLYLPYLAATRGVFELARVLSREPAFAVVAPNLTFGRRLTDREARRADFASVLDLTAEFTEVRAFRELPGYLCLPVFDTHAPTSEQLRYAVDWLKEAVARGPVYVHCALGHGRSACVVLAYLLATGAVASYADGLKLLREKRPMARLHASQREAVRAFEPPSAADGR